MPYPPIVDFNGDGIVNCADMCIMVDHWGENYPLCDIGPTCFGDRVVDFPDFAVLSEYWLADHRLVAHWKLDETDGTIGYDSAGDKDGTLHDGPLWQPAGGIANGCCSSTAFMII